MGINLCGCNDNLSPSTETNLVIISTLYKNMLQVPKKIETIQNSHKKLDLDTNSRFCSNFNSISQNDNKSLNIQHNIIFKSNEKEEVTKI